MLGKIAALVLALAIGVGAGLEAQAQTKTTTPAKSPKPVHKAAPKSTSGAQSATTRPSPRKKPAAQSASTRRPSPRRVQPVKTAQRSATATRGVRAAKNNQLRAAGRMVRPNSRLAVRPTAASRSAIALPDKRRSTRFGRMPTFTMPSPLPDNGVARALSLYNVHTGESLNVTYWHRGQYVQSELDRLNDFLRDSRSGDQVQMDPKLFDILWQVRRQLGSTATYRVLSGYRSPQTNAWLASVSSGVASDSLHMRGQAMDVMLPGRTAGQIRQAARMLGLGGVGYYPRSGFVHLDTGPVRYW